MIGQARAIIMKTKEKLSRDFVATIGAWQMGFKCGPQEKFVRLRHPLRLRAF